MLGSCALKPASDPFKSICEILDHCINRNKEMKERLTAVQTDYDRLSAVQTDYNRLTAVQTDYDRLTAVQTDYDRISQERANALKVC